MRSDKLIPKSTDEFIATFPKAMQAKLQQIRATIKKSAPKAEEVIKYGMPAYILKGNLVFFGGYKNHIGFYPGASTVEEFKKDLTAYETSKGAIQFPLNKPLPLRLIATIVKFRIWENEEKETLKNQRRKK